MQAQDNEALEVAAWQAFVQDLGAFLARAWPATQERLAERYPAFIEHAVQQAVQRGLHQAVAAARYVNLCIVWGPSFQDRVGFEWARGLLAAPAHRAWLTAHQLVRRSLAELTRRPEARIDPDTLARVDTDLLDRFELLGCHGAMLRAEPAPAPRAACDLDAAELKLLDGTQLMAYQLTGDEWQRTALVAPAPLRMDLAHPAPPLLSVLTCAPGQGKATRLQARLRAQVVCNGDHHPAVGFGGSHGLWQWRGHETRAVSWPVTTLTQPEPVAGPGSAIAVETAPEIHRLDLDVCGLRDEGDAFGAQRLQIWAWPITQYWIEIQRQAPPLGEPGSAKPAAARSNTRCRVEADGVPQETGRMETQFTQGLDALCTSAVQSLTSQWTGLPGFEKPTHDGSFGLLLGRAALTWGWRYGPQGLAGRALMRICGRLAMSACRIDTRWGAELEIEGVRARIRLSLVGDVAFEREVLRESDELPVLDTVLPLQVQVSIPVLAEVEPLAGDTGGLLQLAGPAAGALVGEVGLRPRLSGGSGWEWFAAMRLTAVQVPIALSDPFLGNSTRTVTLWPAQTLVDWKLG